MIHTHYYIDEAGGINNNSNFFILGCFKTDTPEELKNSIGILKSEILNDAYFAFERTKLLKKGFHACENHPDIRAKFYSLLSKSNLRAYILLLKKDSEYFRTLLVKKQTPDNIYNLCIKKLLSDRLTKTRCDSNIIIFEEYGSKPQKWLTNVSNIISEIASSIEIKFKTELNYQIKIHNKSDLNLSVIDYINYLFIQLFENNKCLPRMLDNFKILEPKIGLVYKMDKDSFFHKNNRLNPEKY